MAIDLYVEPLSECTVSCYTETMTATVDAALDEVIRLRQRRHLVELLFTPGRLDLDDPDVMAGAWS
jgi:hypothetical protein